MYMASAAFPVQSLHGESSRLHIQLRQPDDAGLCVILVVLLYAETLLHMHHLLHHLTLVRQCIASAICVHGLTPATLCSLLCSTCGCCLP